MANTRISPFIKRLRTNGGSIYVFSSASQDIGLNINERNNKVKISNFALLEIPNITESSTGYKNNTFNVRNIVGAWEYEQNNASVKDGRILIAESFQNYALNLEANLLALNTYNPQLSATISERVFWKWLKEIGTVRWNDPSTLANGTTYWNEEIGSNNYSSVIKYIGQVSAGNVRVDTFGTYNETYILVPTSHGQTRAYFKQMEDDNYHHGIEIPNGGENILGRDNYMKPHPDGLSFSAYYDFVDSSIYVGTTPYYTYYDNSTGSYSPGWWYNAEGFNPISLHNAYLTDSSSYLNTKIYNVDLKYQGGSTITFRRSKLDCMSIEFNLDNLKMIYGDPTLSFDRMATDYQVSDSFMFNAVLIYYSIYNTTMDTILATNLLGVMFLDAPSGNSSEIGTGLQGIQLPSLEKIASGVNGFGTSYSLRLNIKTDNMLDDTQAVIIDESTSDQLWPEEWQTAFQNLAIAVNTLTQQNATFNYISGQYVVLQGNQTQILNRLIGLENIVAEIGRDIKGIPGTVPLFTDGDDPLTESSIYMRYGRVGIFNNDPKYPVDIDANVKTLDLTIENAIRDTSGNILIGYGSPLQIGSSTNFREVNIYSGQDDPAFIIDISNNINLNGDVSIIGQLEVDSSVVFKSSVLFESSIMSPFFDFSKTYMRLPQNVGSGLTWDGTYLNTIPSSDVSAPGIKGDIQFAGSGGSLSADPSSRIVWDSSNGRLGVGIKTPLYTAHVVGKLNVDGSILLNGALFTVTPPAGLNTQLQINNSGSFGGSLLTWNGATFGIDGSILFTNTLNRTISIAAGTTARTLTISSNNQSASGGNGGEVILNGGISGASGGNGGDVSINGGLSIGVGGGVGGSIYIYGGGATNNGSGGNIYIGGGIGGVASGLVFIKGFSANFRNLNISGNILSTDDTIQSSDLSGVPILTLPDALSNPGKIFRFHRKTVPASDYDIKILAGGSDKIEYSNTYILLKTEGSSVTIQSTGVSGQNAWIILGSYGTITVT